MAHHFNKILFYQIVLLRAFYVLPMWGCSDAILAFIGLTEVKGRVGELCKLSGCY